jgi:hypothetical protein
MLGFGAGAAGAGAAAGRVAVGAAAGAAVGAVGAGAVVVCFGMLLTLDDWRPKDLLPPIGRADSSLIMLIADSAIIAPARNFFIFIVDVSHFDASV